MNRVTLTNVGVTFPIYSSSDMNLKRQLLSWGKRREPSEIDALKSVSLIVKHGDRIGIRGPNGAGKSTLLRVISGILSPTSGEVSIQGRAVALIDHSLGFDIQCSGIENIYRRGIYCGFSRDHISKIASEIIEFSELGKRIFHPVSTYSSGMRARLAFSISTSLRSDLLVIDEGIGFADRDFLAKGTKRVEEFYSGSGAVVIASHDENLLANYCNRIITMQEGQLIGQ